MLNRRTGSAHGKNKKNAPTPPQSKDLLEDHSEVDARTPLTDEQFSKVKDIIKEVYYASNKLLEIKEMLMAESHSITEEQWFSVQKIFTTANSPYRENSKKLYGDLLDAWKGIPKARQVASA